MNFLVLKIKKNKNTTNKQLIKEHGCDKFSLCNCALLLFTTISQEGAQWAVTTEATSCQHELLMPKH